MAEKILPFFRRRLFPPALAATLLLSSAASPALRVGGDERERALLMQIGDELTLLINTAKRAEALANPAALMLFDYAALQRDLRDIRTALLTHLSEPSRLPRELDKLQLNYSRDR